MRLLIGGVLLLAGCSTVHLVAQMPLSTERSESGRPECVARCQWNLPDGTPADALAFHHVPRAYVDCLETCGVKVAPGTCAGRAPAPPCANVARTTPDGGSILSPGPCREAQDETRCVDLDRRDFGVIEGVGIAVVTLLGLALLVGYLYIQFVPIHPP